MPPDCELIGTLLDRHRLVKQLFGSIGCDSDAFERHHDGQNVFGVQRLIVHDLLDQSLDHDPDVLAGILEAGLVEDLLHVVAVDGKILSAYSRLAEDHRKHAIEESRLVHHDQLQCSWHVHLGQQAPRLDMRRRRIFELGGASVDEHPNVVQL